MGINKGFDADINDNISVTIDELCEHLQQLQKELEEQTGIYISTVVSGPNRSVYPAEWGCPGCGEVTYTIHAVSDARLQLKEPVDEEKLSKAVSMAFLITHLFGSFFLRFQGYT